MHLNVRDLQAHKKFWRMLGGTPHKIDGTDVMKFPGVFVFMTPGRPPVGTPPAQLQVLCGCPSDGFEPGVIKHLGFGSGFASVELTDPWGISIELTEGLSRY